MLAEDAVQDTLLQIRGSDVSDLQVGASWEADAGADQAMQHRWLPGAAARIAHCRIICETIERSGSSTRHGWRA